MSLFDFQAREIVMNLSPLYYIFYGFLLNFISCSTPASNGFGDHIKWVEYSSALQDTNKPSMIILHKSWCPACKNLKPKLAENPEFAELSEKFSMVNAGEGEDLHDNTEFNVDGSYIPRIFFLNPQGQVLTEIQNSAGNPNYKFYYFNSDSVLQSMRQVLDQFPSKEEL